MEMSQVNVKMKPEIKQGLEEFCSFNGMNISVLFNIFARKVIREQRLPFEIEGNPFYSEVNMQRVERSIQNLCDGKGVEHELIEVDE